MFWNSGTKNNRVISPQLRDYWRHSPQVSFLLAVKSPGGPGMANGYILYQNSMPCYLFLAQTKNSTN